MALQLNQTNEDRKAAEFSLLGMNIIVNKERLETSVFDKRNTFPFTVHRYPMIHSLMPTSMVYNVFISQLHRGYRLCSKVEDFVDYASEVADRLIKNGCASNRLRKMFNTFATHHARKYIRVSHGMLRGMFKDRLLQLTM